MKAKEAFDQNNGEVTRQYYRDLNAKGIYGELGVALFRAQKRSMAAKKYRGKRISAAAYEVKNWSMNEIVRLLKTELMPCRWGWGEDPTTVGYPWVLYVDLVLEEWEGNVVTRRVFGQVSFHSAERLAGPDYCGGWDGSKASTERILAFCDAAMGLVAVAV
jgi:hypothetical protein